MTRWTRREFLRWASTAAAGATLAATGCMPRSDETEASQPPPDPTAPPSQTDPTQAPPTEQPPGATAQPSQPPPTPTDEPAYLAAIRGADPAAVTTAAIAALGGIQRFVPSGADVIIKPNICVAYHPPEYAATTNPTVVATLVRLCLDAGARRVRVMDHPFGGAPDAAYDVSGIADAVRAAGGEMEIMSPVKYAQFDIPEGRDITAWDVYRDVIEADVVINVPIAKHHSLARLTLGGKNLMGVITSRNLMHRNLGQRIADLTSLVRPTLTVVDAVRILTAHGPSGGDLNDVTRADTVIASADIVAADAYAATLFDLTGADISYVQAAAEMGLGTLDLGAVNVVEAEI